MQNHIRNFHLLHDNQDFALLKIQEDTNGNGKYDVNDKWYYQRLDLKTLTLSHNKIEIK